MNMQKPEECVIDGRIVNQVCMFKYLGTILEQVDSSNLKFDKRSRKQIKQ